MAGDLLLLDGGTLFLSQENGDVAARQPQGFFFNDVRHLSEWRLLVEGRPLSALTSQPVDYFSGRIVVAPTGKDPSFSVERNRFVTEGAHEDLIVSNHSAQERVLRLDLHLGADFADVLEAQQPGSFGRETRVEVARRGITFIYEQDGVRRATRVGFNRQGELAEDRASFEVALGPHGSWKLCVDITAIEGRKAWRPLLRCDSFDAPEPELPTTLPEWLAQAPQLEANDELQSVYEQSLVDLAALRIRPREENLRWALPAGGVPWFLTVFGRDSLIASYEALPFQPTLARATLEALAELQASEWDDFRDAEPGKIPHELRRGTLVQLGLDPHGPYYGTHDATQLFLILLDEYERWSADTAFVRRLEPHARRALEWIDEYGDLDGDGYLEYQSRSAKGLRNHCWKDSDSGIQSADGTTARLPIATCEIQGYTYDARRRAARLARELFGDEELAADQEQKARRLRERFNRDFWDDKLGFYVVALDGEKRRVDAVTSNPGHLLWSGIVPRSRARTIADRLLRDDLFSGWGIRSLSSAMDGYNPLEYHAGTVWPHDSALCAEGMRRYGLREHAGRVCRAILEAAVAFDYRLPELFAGFARDQTGLPISYPDALAPQAWAAGAPLLALRTLLGLDVVEGRLRSQPRVPKELGRLRLKAVPVRKRRASTPV
ncbi:MAG TPA: glycogen debranching N-terminal domain-containing protein [Gaiellaceae bacterium]